MRYLKPVAGVALILSGLSQFLLLGYPVMGIATTALGCALVLQWLYLRAKRRRSE